MATKIDLTGQRFGKLVAIEPTERRRSANVIWRCQCDCGNEHFATAKDLRAGSVKSCGCARGKDVAGQRFGKLVAIEPTERRQGTSIIWRCQCDCGNEHFVPVRSLIDGNTKSCGCLNFRSRECTDAFDGTKVSTLTKTLFSSNTSGIRGVSWDKQHSKWAAYIKYKGRIYHLGLFRDIEDARKARERAEESLHGSFLKDFSASVLERAGSSEKNIQGERYGTLSVLHAVMRGKRIVWRCQCDCGELMYMDAESLLSGAAVCSKCQSTRK